MFSCSQNRALTTQPVASSTASSSVNWGPSFSQPSVVAAVDLYQHSLASHPLPSNTMLRRPATARTVHTGVSQYLAQRVTTDVYALSLPQQLAQVRVVDSRVSGPRQDHHVGRQRVRCSVGRSATSIAVSECGCSLLAVGRQNTPGVARAHSHQSRCLLRGHMVRHQTVENLKPCLLSLRQCHMLLHADIFP